MFPRCLWAFEWQRGGRHRIVSDQIRKECEKTERLRWLLRVHRLFSLLPLFQLEYDCGGGSAMCTLSLLSWVARTSKKEDPCDVLVLLGITFTFNTVVRAACMAFHTPGKHDSKQIPRKVQTPTWAAHAYDLKSIGLKLPTMAKTGQTGCCRQNLVLSIVWTDLIPVCSHADKIPQQPKACEHAEGKF